MWYVIRTTIGREESAIEQCKIAVGTVAKRFILPKGQFYWRSQGEYTMINKVSFPGYFFIDSDDPKELEELLMRIPSVVEPVRIGGGFHPIKKEEEDILQRLMDKNDLILASVGNLIDGKLIVEEGPLKGLEDRVVKFNRHDRWANLEVALFDGCKTMKVGLEIKARMTEEEYLAKRKVVRSAG